MPQKFIEAYNDIPPIGNILRTQYGDFSFRVHHLQNKQYPENNDDKEIILNLYDKLLPILCKTNKLLGLISFYDFDFNELENHWLSELNLTFFKKYNINEEDDSPYYVKVYSFEINQNSPILKNIILDIADEEFDGSLLLYCDNNHVSTVIAPYPGGIDIFNNNKKEYNLTQSEISSLGIKIENYKR
jgi:hypothetical protein